MGAKILHIADVHLDAPFRWLGNKGQAQRRQLKETFRAIVDLALAERVDALLVAGDLFDSNWPSQDSVDLVRGQLARLNMPAVILPGTHDCLDGASVYRRVSLSVPGGPAIHVFDGERSIFALGPLLAVHGRANLTKTSQESPLRGLRRDPSARFNVALAHGSLAMPGTEGDFPITQGEIAGSGMDYVALGHWHAYRDCSSGSTTACYSGPPELLAEGEQGYALLVELGEGSVAVEQRALSRRRFERLALPLDQVQGPEEIAAQIRARRDEELVLSVTLSGLRPLSLVIDAERLAQELAEGFFALRVADTAHPVLAAEEIAALPENTVAGQFARRMSALIAQAPDAAERRTREVALQVGLALLQGRRVL